MTYLLTEIALEMLGYRFYDTDGVQRETNFKDIVTPSPSDDKDLEMLLGLDTTARQAEDESVSRNRQLENENVRNTLKSEKATYMQSSVFLEERKHRPAEDLLDEHLSKCVRAELETITKFREEVEARLMSSLPAQTLQTYTRLFKMNNNRPEKRN